MTAQTTEPNDGTATKAFLNKSNSLPPPDAQLAVCRRFTKTIDDMKFFDRDNENG